MAIAARTATKGTATSSGAFTVTFATGSAAGDIVVLFVANAGTAGPAAPVGWTRYRNADSAGTAQSLTTFTAPWSAGLTASFTNAASVAAWVCNSYSGGNFTVMTDGAGAATSNTTNNTTLPTGAPTTGSVAGDYEVLGYAFTSAGTISVVAAGSTIDATQANSTSVSAVLGHNNTTSLGATTATTAFSQTLSASNTRKTGVGILLLALNPLSPAPATLTLALTGSVPAISLPILASPATLTTALTGSVPAVTTTANLLISPTSLPLSLTGATPAVRLPILTSPSTLPLTLTGAVPAVSLPILVSPSALTLALTGAVPAVRLPVAASPSSLAVALTGAVPAISLPLAVNPSALAIALAFATPTVTVGTGGGVIAPAPVAARTHGGGPPMGAATVMGPAGDRGPHSSVRTTPARQSARRVLTLDDPEDLWLLDLGGPD